MDALTSYTMATSAWFTVQAVPLLLYPRLIITLLSPTARDPTGASAIFYPTPVLGLYVELKEDNPEEAQLMPISQALQNSKSTSPAP